tara:strand:+ start:2977 stop:3252 length:276 start_codon:yes stop_codon:yes gene_type:complete
MTENNNEMTGVTPEMIDHTNIQGDVSENQKHFVEISFDGFRLCETTTDEISLDDFNEKVLNLWKSLDAFLLESMQRRQKAMKKSKPGRAYQ